jgi:hypothetical protein
MSRREKGGNGCIVSTGDEAASKIHDALRDGMPVLVLIAMFVEA